MATSSGATATQQNQYNPGRGKITTCSSADSRTRPHALRWILRTPQHSKQNLRCRTRAFTNLVPNSAPISYHIVIMSFTELLVKILEYMFVAGWIGSAIVLLLTGVEDVETLLDREDEPSQ